MRDKDAVSSRTLEPVDQLVGLLAAFLSAFRRGEAEQAAQPDKETPQPQGKRAAEGAQRDLVEELLRLRRSVRDQLFRRCARGGAGACPDRSSVCRDGVALYRGERAVKAFFAEGRVGFARGARRQLYRAFAAADDPDGVFPVL